MKKKFEVLETETIGDCLDRMAKEGFMPVRRMEEPVFEEIREGNKVDYRPIRQKIVFEGVKKD